MVVTHKLSLDLIRWHPSPRIDVMQDDKYSRDLQIRLFADGVAYCPPEGCSALIRYSKADCTGGAYDILPDGTRAWTICENVMTIRLAPQVCTKDGPVELVVTLFSGNSELNCFELELLVWKNPKGVYSSSRYVNVTGFIPQPASAAVGQYLEVAAVDKSGRIAELRAVDAPEGGSGPMELPENIVTADLTNAEGTESETVPVNADTLGGELPDAYARRSDFIAQDFTSQVVFSDLPAAHHESTHFVKVGDMVYIYYCGGNGTVSNNTELFTIPEGFRPYYAEVATPFAINAVTYGTTKINGSNGVCVVMAVNSTTASGRIRFSISYLCETANVKEVTA